MGVRDRVGPERAAPGHACQFFDSDETRADAVADFIRQGFEEGETVLVIARPAQWEAICGRLAARGVDVRREAERGTLVIRDAADSLQRLSAGGHPTPGLFEKTIGVAVRALHAGGRLRAYGAMVDILAERGDLDDMLALERLWNRLGRTVPFTLLCGYSSAHFVSPAAGAALSAVCRAHTHVRHSAEDPLGNWLRRSSHAAGPGSSLLH